MALLDHHPAPDPDDMTRLIRASAAGDSVARDRLLEAVYTDLHAMARRRMGDERRDHTLGATALVSEAYLRLFRGADGTPVPAPWADRQGFFAAAAMTMRRILVDHARARMAVKRGGAPGGAVGDGIAVGAGTPGDAADAAPGGGNHGNRGERWRRVPLDALEAARAVDPSLVLELDEALDGLAAVDPRAAEVVRLRFFAGLEFAEIAGMLSVADRTCKRDWAFARAWLHEALGIGDPPAPEATT